MLKFPSLFGVSFACLFLVGCGVANLEPFDPAELETENSQSTENDAPRLFSIDPTYSFESLDKNAIISGTNALAIVTRTLSIQDLVEVIQPNTVLSEKPNYNDLLVNEFPQYVTEAGCGSVEVVETKVSEQDTDLGKQEIFNREFVGCKRGRFVIDGKSVLESTYDDVTGSTIKKFSYDGLLIDDLITGEVFAFIGIVEHVFTPGLDYHEIIKGLISSSQDEQFEVFIETALDGSFNGESAIINHSGYIDSTNIGRVELLSTWDSYADIEMTPIILSIIGDKMLSLNIASEVEIVVNLFNDQTDTKIERFGAPTPYAFLLNQSYELTQEIPVANFLYSPSNLSVNSPTILDGSTSYDPDFGLLSFTWEVEAQSTNAHAEIEDVNAKSTAITFHSAGNYTVSLVVNDGSNDSEVFSRELVIE